MFSVWKMIRKGAVALLCFAGPAIIGVLFKIIPGINNLTIGDLIVGIIDKIIPNFTMLSVGTGLVMLINWIKNRK